MDWIKLPRQLIVLTLALSAALISNMCHSTQLQAQPAKDDDRNKIQTVNQDHFVPTSTLNTRSGFYLSHNSKSVVPTLRFRFVPPLPPPDQGSPTGRRKGGASRCPECKDSNLSLTALVPGINSKSSLAFTVASHPTFWFYVPYALTPSSSFEFVLQDEQDNYIYKTTFTSPGTPAGIVSIPLPTKETSLEIGKQYHWTFVIHSNRQPSSYVAVDGFVQRVAPTLKLTKQLKNMTPRERTVLYAANGIWHDALTTLASLLSAYPRDTMLTAEWVGLLQSVGLDNIATQPFVQCCIGKQASND